eukprot:CAMPEP_0113508616 /NCGR_PEP_ID=MMETSP0014_2-20120614/37121_1 /TAXON_ID=2857 /ORGANISM="Nitzschia sp." /LENGTH=653 /DNA_ID=CAMNT_0000404359 /DNA_START=250 /DNA_END=2208 /DNA_ORIENTATION=+ /assembly_acc=CAM_ASM_000159
MSEEETGSAASPTARGLGGDIHVDDDDDEKGHTFRKRRLSLTHLREAPTNGNGKSEEDREKQNREGGDVGEGEKIAAAGASTANGNHSQIHLEEDEAEEEDKAHTFRKRRLSLTHKKEDAASLGSNEEELPSNQEGGGVDDGQHQGTIEMVVTTLNDNHDAHDEHQHQQPPPAKRQRRGSADSVDTHDTHGSDGSRKPLRSRTLHAGELLASPHAPPLSPSSRAAAAGGAAASAGGGASPHAATDSGRAGRSGSFDLSKPLPKLYQQAAPPQQQSQLALLDDPRTYGAGGVLAPRWKKKHHPKHGADDKALPFPRDIVGTFSCHGVEPIYDSDDYPEEDEDEDDDDYYDEDGGVSSSLRLPTGLMQSNQQSADKPTMAAKINQDRGGVAYPYANNKKTALFAVYDGHGQGGEFVSQYALHEVQRLLEKHPDFKTDIEKAFKETFLTVDSSLFQEQLIEPMYAGTTACVCLMRDKKLVLSNAGDSRAVIARRRKVDGQDGGMSGWEALDLTEDQNPDLPEEQSRIEEMGGFVSPPPEPGLSARVWLDAECTQIGLAMARSIGDHAVKTIGVIAEPVVTYHDVQEEDEFLILATDGVWEFISSSEAVNIVANNLHKGATKACRALIEAAAARWHDEEGDYRDDITALVIRLPHLW